MILVSTPPHKGYDFLLKYGKEIKSASRYFDPCPSGVESDDEFIFPDSTKLLVLTGGEDVSSYRYGRIPHPTAHYSLERDKYEFLMWEAARRQKIPVLGICRGLQFINVMCDGELVQHTSGHAGRPHSINCLHSSIKEFSGRYVTSLHHQMIIPPENAEILAISERRSGFYLSMPKTTDNKAFTSLKFELELDVPQEVEAAFYKEQLALGVQFHPELSRIDQADISITQRLIEEFLL